MPSTRLTRQLPLRIGFIRRATFANFIIGANPELVDALSAWLTGRMPGELFYLWGSPASGRSHLLAAAGDTAETTGASFAYVPLAEAETLAPAMFEGLETCQLVCLDDIDAVAGNRAWEEALFHLYNRLRDAGHHMLVSAACSPGELGLALADLKSRLGWGLTYYLQPLDDDGKRDLMRQQATERGLELSPEAADYLLSRCPRDTRALVRLMEQLDTAAMAAQRRLTIPFLHSQLGAD
jgi:DnaA family protein